MQNKHWALLITAATLTLVACVSFGDDDDEHRGGFLKRAPGVTPVDNALYTEECGSCHFPYQPGLLPERSWRKIMLSLQNHFGDNAEQEPQNQQSILNYLLANSADKSSSRRSKKIMRYLAAGETPLRITRTRYFIKEHDEIPSRLVTGNPQVLSFSNCNNCHTKVERGSFSERDIVIAGYGRWDD